MKPASQSLENDGLAVTAALLSSDMKMAARRGTVENGHRKLNGVEDVPRPFLIGVAGGTASGKSTVCKKITEQLGQNEVEQNQKQVVVISMEDFYKPLSEDDQLKARKGLYNFDHPSAFDEDFLLRTIEDIKSGRPVKIPSYDIASSTRKDSWKIIHPADVILVEGILVFYFKEIRDLFNMKLFVDTDADTRLSRRVMRDMREMGRDLDQILYQYINFVKPAFEEFCLPTKKYADVIIPRGADNVVAIDLIVQHIQDLLKPTQERHRNHRVRTSSDSLVSRPH